MLEDQLKLLSSVDLASRPLQLLTSANPNMDMQLLVVLLWSSVSD
jgi:hypothetical protein